MSDVEFNALVQVVEITADRDAALTRVVERWGINYFAVRELDGFEDVIRALR